MPNLIISSISVRQDSEGRYYLNDLHKASGSKNKHRPSLWLENQQTKDLVAEYEKDEAGIPASKIIKGRSGGTYAVKELIYAYAMWISPSFSLKVIRAYDSQQTPQTPQPLDALPGALQLESFHLIEDSLQQLLYQNYQNLVDIRVLIYIKDGVTHFTKHLTKTERVMDASDFEHFFNLESNLTVKYDLDTAAFVGIDGVRVYMHIKDNQPKLVKQLSASELVIDTLDLLPILETATILEEKYALSRDSISILEL